MTGRIWASIGMHAAWNFTQGEIYDIPVSGTEVHGLLNARLVGPPLLTGIHMLISAWTLDIQSTPD